MDPRGLLKFLAPLKNRIMLMLARGIVTAVEQEGALPTLRARFLAGEEHGDIPLMQQYGFASRPLPGAECVVAFMGGERSQGVAVATCDRRFIPVLGEGEVVIYSAEDGLAFGEEAPEWAPEPPEGAEVQGLCRIALKPGRKVEITCEELEIKVNGVPYQFGGEGGSEGIARIGVDRVVVDHGSSAGEYVIVRGDDA